MCDEFCTMYPEQPGEPNPWDGMEYHNLIVYYYQEYMNANAQLKTILPASDCDLQQNTTFILYSDVVPPNSLGIDNLKLYTNY